MGYTDKPDPISEAVLETSVRTACAMSDMAAITKDSALAMAKDALERLGSSEGMTGSFVIRDNQEGGEIKARMQYARDRVAFIFEGPSSRDRATNEN